MLISSLTAFVTILVLGGVLGFLLAVAARVFAVKKDEKVIEVEGILPGINCGACGFAGCAAYAEAIVQQGAELSLCSPGGAAVAGGLGRAMGVEVQISGDRKVAQVLCRGNRERTEQQFEFQGVEDCNALYLYFGGDKVCKYGCLGLGSCIRVCPVDAISYDAEGCVWVDRDKCISCGKCLDVCPTHVMQWVPASADVVVACNSVDKGALVRKYCKVGCIGCKICEKKSPEGGFMVENNLARIDYARTGERETAKAACPPKCIINADMPATAAVPVGEEKAAE